MLKICFIGLGSIGKRHIQNLVSILQKRGIQFEIDAVRSSSAILPDNISEMLHKQYSIIKEIPSDYDIIFITNPTVYHYETIRSIVLKTKHIFIEKPVFDHSIENLDQLGLKKEHIYYVACPMRYSSALLYLRERIKKETIFSVRAISSSYLPDWRNNIDYRQNYSAKKEMGGGVTRDLIHEFDYITWLFGIPDKIFHMQDKVSQLQITSDDLSVYLLKYQDKIAEIHLDYFGRKATRYVELYCADYMIKGDFIQNKVFIINEEETKEIVMEEDLDYLREMESFLDMIEKKKENDNSIYHANEILRLAEEQS